MQQEALYWLDQADELAGEAAKYFQHSRPQTGADNMARSVAIIESFVPLVTLLGKRSITVTMTHWVSRLTECLVRYDCVALIDALLYERAFISEIQSLVRSQWDALDRLDSVLAQCLLPDPSTQPCAPPAATKD
jgi:hypothetical protein